MNMRIQSTENVTEIRWTGICKACPYCTFFHSPAWYNTISSYLGIKYIPVSERIVFSDGSSALVVYLRRRGLFDLYSIRQSSPFGTYGGWISTDTLDSTKAALLGKYLTARRSVEWRENPFDPVLGSCEIPGAQNDFTQVIDLTRSKDQLFEASSHAHHKALQRAQREGIITREASSAEEWKAYYGIYEDSIRRWRSHGPTLEPRIIYRYELFEKLRAQQDTCRLWIAIKDQTIIAGIVVFYWNAHAVAWHGAALSDYFQMRPNNILYWTAICDAQSRGYRRFDCNPSGGYEGVAQFKEHLGAQKKRSRLFRRQTPAAKLVLGIRSLLLH